MQWIFIQEGHANYRTLNDLSCQWYRGRSSPTDGGGNKRSKPTNPVTLVNG